MSARVLVVDDDIAVRESLVDDLSGLYDVTAVSSGSEAMAELDRRRYDAIVSDLRMPDHDGIAVLDHAYRCDQDMIRVLLTGYLDEHAHRAVLQPHAPFKVGKPWHDQLEVVLRRAFEHRADRRQLAGSVVDALAVATVDDELAGAAGFRDVAELLVRRVRRVHGVNDCAVTMSLGGIEHLLVGTPPRRDQRGDHGWFLEESLGPTSPAWLTAAGVGEGAKEIVQHLCARVRAWEGRDDARNLAHRMIVDPQAHAVMNDVCRQALVGSMSGALFHEVASLIQIFECASYELSTQANPAHLMPDARTALEDATLASRQLVRLCVAMREFLRSGQISPRRVSLRHLLETAQVLSHSVIRPRSLHAGIVPPVYVSANESLLLQVVVTLLRATAESAAADEDLELQASELGADAQILIHRRHRPHAEAEEVQPLVTAVSVTATDIELAAAASIVSRHGGTIHYLRDGEVIVGFSVSVPVAGERTPGDDDDEDDDGTSD